MRGGADTIAEHAPDHDVRSAAAPVSVIAPRLLLSTAPFYRVPLRDALRIVSGAGYRAVEVMVTNDPTTQDPHLLRQAAEDYGVTVDVIHAPFLLITRRVWGTDPLGKIYRSVQLAEEVGAEVVVVHQPYRWQGRFRRYHDKVLHVHLSNNAGKGWDSHLPVYDENGVLPIGAFLDELSSSRYPGSISLELDLRPWQKDEKLLTEVLVRNREFVEEIGRASCRE